MDCPKARRAISIGALYQRHRFVKKVSYFRFFSLYIKLIYYLNRILSSRMAILAIEGHDQ